MTTLLEWKEKAKQIYGEYGRVIEPCAKFFVAFLTLLVIRVELGYMSSISSIPVTLVLALLCAFLPQNVTLYILGIVVLGDLYALSTEVFAVSALLFLVIILLYLRFAPKTTYLTLLTVLGSVLHVPYLVAGGAGLLYGPGAVVSVGCGIFIRYYVRGISENDAALASADSSATTVLSTLLSQITGNREMILMLLVLMLMTLLVYLIRRSSMDHSWSVAILTGFLVEFIILFAGLLIMGYATKLIWLVIGNVISFAGVNIIQFLFFNVDYKRTETVQFEDDDYYYYVKAVPKIKVSSQEKKVKKFKASGRRE